MTARLTLLRLASATLDWDGALATVAELRALRPDEPFVHYERAVIHAGRGDVVAALAALELALAGAKPPARRRTQADPRLSALARDPGFLALTADTK